MNTFWFALNIIALIYILGGYVVLFKVVDEADEVFARWSKRVKWTWLGFFLVAASCFLATQVILTFYTDDDKLDNGALVASYILLLFSTTVWLPMLVLSKSYTVLKFVVSANVVVTAISAVIFTVTLHNVSLTAFGLSLPLVVHVVCWDGMFWNYQFLTR